MNKRRENFFVVRSLFHQLGIETDQHKSRRSRYRESAYWISTSDSYSANSPLRFFRVSFDRTGKVKEPNKSSGHDLESRSHKEEVSTC